MKNEDVCTKGNTGSFATYTISNTGEKEWRSVSNRRIIHSKDRMAIVDKI